MIDDESFLKLLDASRQSTWDVAAWLKSRGHNVRIVPSLVRPDSSVRFQFSDEGDIEITQRIEVKHKYKMDFNSIDEWPYDPVIIDEAYKFDKTPITTLHSFIILNMKKTGFLYIPESTHRHWFREARFDSRHGKELEFMMVAKEHVQYVSMK